MPPVTSSLFKSSFLLSSRLSSFASLQTNRQCYSTVYFNIQWFAQGMENRIVGWIWDSHGAP
jgi:hypothetical protein